MEEGLQREEAAHLDRQPDTARVHLLVAASAASAPSTAACESGATSAVGDSRRPPSPTVEIAHEGFQCVINDTCLQPSLANHFIRTTPQVTPTALILDQICLPTVESIDADGNHVETLEVTSGLHELSSRLP